MSLNVAISGLLAFKRALDTTAHNISNVQTEGYSRQRIELNAQSPQFSGSGFVGSGVSIDSVKRMYDQFRADQVVSKTSSFNELETFYDLAVRLDQTLGDYDSGLAPTLQDFFSALQTVANDPTSTAARQVMLAEANTLSDRINGLGSLFGDLRINVNDQLTTTVSSINALAENIASINTDIVNAIGMAGGQPPNDLLDQRDKMVLELARYINVNTLNQSDGSLSVFIGNGQTLVIGQKASALSVTANVYEASKLEISYKASGLSSYTVTEQLSGGVLGGLLQYRDEILDSTQDGIGRMALVLANLFNVQHQLGDDLSGAAGGNFFSPIDGTSPVVLPSTNNNPASGTVSVTISTISEIEAEEYRLFYDGANFNLQRTSDDSTVSTFAPGAMPYTVPGIGLTLGLTGSVATGDSFLVRPVREAAGDMKVLITDPAAIAAAANGNALGDNSNVLLLAGLQTQSTINNNTASFQNAFAEIVADVGVKTRQAELNSKAQKALLNQAIDRHSTISGVNLDEEAANLVVYQQAYQASAQVIAVVNSLFQTLLGVVGRR